MRINNNLMAMNTHRQLGTANTDSAKSMEKLSSGYRINRAGDDAAGLAISEKMRGQIRGLNQASANSQDAISLIQTTEGALNETHAILQRMRELAVQSSTDTNTNADRSNLQDEIDQLATEITRISTDTQFNTMGVLDGSFKEKTFHIGANEGQNIELTIDAMGASDLKVDGKLFEGGIEDVFTITDRVGGRTVSVTVAADDADKLEIGGTDTAITIALAGGDHDATTNAQLKVELEKLGFEVSYVDDVKGSTAAAAGTTGAFVEETEGSYGVDISTQSAADTAITTVNSALENVSKERSKLGAIQNRLEHTIKNLDTSAENLQASESRIRDVDMAKEMMEQTKQNILSQASTAMLAQANQAPQGVLQLLR